MHEEVILITGANGEIGHGLIHHLADQKKAIVALDLNPLDDVLQPLVRHWQVGDILNFALLEKLFEEYHFSVVFHLASILSTKAEQNPELAHKVNVEGTLNLLRLAEVQSRRDCLPVKFIYPSSIAVYCLPNLETKQAAGKVREDQFTTPATMYGINKLYCEHLGRYYSKHYKQLANNANPDELLDFRALRFPGLISSETVPTGGTSDYGPEMLHAAAKGVSYDCFVRPDTRLPFMVMPDAVKSLITLKEAPRQALTQTVYNVTSFNPSAQELYELTVAAFPKADIRFVPDCHRQCIVDSWPADIDDSAAQRDWGWQPDYNFDRAFSEYLVPVIRARYQ
ncbi:MAG TPA: NAD-dependent epimerase/dehydratase family protein [Anaerolineaceae bacterium]|nr:NAD-dependent epimerase/dehydratase family protein [Anaerolineaceae bacterium]HQJ32132.1 NAD-dependent epimerase/dehydratase family protein [Anaerolineaceae bacterium]